MSNVVSMTKSCDYLVRRAAVRRRKGNYDEAMTLLSKARDLYGSREEIEIEMARVYDEIECEEDAARAYLRVVRADGSMKAQALFQLALSALQRADITRAASYFDLFMSSDQNGVSADYVRMLGQQLRSEAERPRAFSRKERSAELIRRGVARMHEGKTAASRRLLERALTLRESARAHTLLACCALMEGDAQRAIDHAKKADDLSPARVHTLLVLADAYAQEGDEKKAISALYLAALRAKDADDALACALESAKRGQDQLTLFLTRKLLKPEPFHTRAMMMRGCAMMNMGRFKEASRLFGRVCVLMPENTVSEALYKMAREERTPSERLSLGMDVPYEEGVARASQLVAALYMSPEDLKGDNARARMLCRYASWAFRSELAGGQVAAVALLAMRMMNTDSSMLVLQDALTDPQVDDTFKFKILQVLDGEEGVKPCPVDVGGRLVRLAAGGSAQGSCSGDLCRRIVQSAADTLSGFKGAPKMLLDLWLSYLNVYGRPPRTRACVCEAALEYAYHLHCKRTVDLGRIAAGHGVPRRLCRFYAGRMLRALAGAAENSINQ